MMPKNLKSTLRDIMKYFLFFLIIPVIGTQMHELGHFFAALSLGCNPIIHFASCSHGCPIMLQEDYFFFVLWGPFSTWIECVTGFVLLMIYRHKNLDEIKAGKISWLYLILLGLTSFCARFVFNAAGYLFSQSTGLDEWKMEDYLGWAYGTIIYGFALIGALILLYNIFIIPKSQRYKLMIGALSGSIAGYALWYYWLGPIFMP